MDVGRGGSSRGRLTATLSRRWAVVVVGALLAAAAAVGALVLAFHLAFNPSPPSARYPAPASALDAQRQDLDYFAAAMALDRSFTPQARALATMKVRTLESLKEALPPPKLQVALMQLMASADNGHTRMDPTAEGRTQVLPLRITPFADGFFVMRVAPSANDLLGGRIEAIDGHPIDEVIPVLETLRGGVEASRRQHAAQFMVVQDLLYGLGIAAESKASTWTVRRPDGQVVTRHLDAYPLPQGQDVHDGDRWLSAERVPGTDESWIARRPASGLVPETWRDLGQHFRRFPVSQSCAQVLRLQRISDADGQRIQPFLASTEAAFRERAPCAVIVDLRGDGGGDYTNTWHFSRELPRLLAPGGRIVILTDSLTFSAAITTAAFMKQAGGNRVTIAGQSIGDRLAFFSEGTKACLPNLKICVHYQTAKHDYGHACNDWHECYWLNWFYPVRVESLQPDIAVPLTFDDWNAGRDAAYSAAVDLVNQPTPSAHVLNQEFRR